MKLVKIDTVEKDKRQKLMTASFQAFLFSAAIIYTAISLVEQIAAAGITSSLGSIIFYSVGFYFFIPALGASVCTVLSLQSTNNYLKTSRRISWMINMMDHLPVNRQTYRVTALAQLAAVHLLEGDFPEAENLYRKILDRSPAPPPQEKTVYPNSVMFRSQLGPALVRMFLGFICDKQLEVEEGQRHFDQARHILNSVPEINTKYGGMLNLYEGACALRANNLQKSETLIAEASKFLQQKGILPGYSELDKGRISSFIHASKALLYLKKDQPEEADIETVQYLNFQIKYPGNTMAIEWLNRLASEYILRSEYVKAEIILEVAYRIGSKTPMHPDNPKLLENFETLLIATDRANECVDMKRWIRPLRNVFDEQQSLSLLDGGYHYESA